MQVRTGPVQRRLTMHVLLIANPIAGTGKNRDKAREFAGILNRRGLVVDLRLCERRGHAHDIAGSIGRDIDRIVVAGGDGTVNEVINGLIDPSRVPILHLPAGTANMLGMELGLPTDLSSLAQVLEKGRVRRIDMGLIGTRRFVLVVGAGFDAAVAREVMRLRGGSLGYMGYLTPITRTLASYRSPRLRVVVDGGRTLVGALVLALKTRYYGGWFHIARDANLGSGCFEIRVVHSGSSAALVSFYLAAASGLSSICRGVTRLRGARIEVESDDAVPVQVDGDYFGTTNVVIELVPAFIPVVGPA